MRVAKIFAKSSSYLMPGTSGVLGLNDSVIYFLVSCEKAPVSMPKDSNALYIRGAKVANLIRPNNSRIQAYLRPILSNI